LGGKDALERVGSGGWRHLIWFDSGLFNRHGLACQGHV
jgi:hypothetical protein